jgi:hypothetical protein
MQKVTLMPGDVRLVADLIRCARRDVECARTARKVGMPDVAALLLADAASDRRIALKIMVGAL